MKTFFILIIFSAVWFLTSIDYAEPVVYTPAVVATTPDDYLFDEPVNDNHWEYLNEFKARFDPKEITCLQRNTYFEAATESKRGKAAVIMVVLNRVESPYFPDTICDVVHQARLDRYGNPIRHRCQFSWYCDGLSDKPDLSRKYNKRVWDEIGALARDIANNGGTDIVGDAMFYHTKDIDPEWDNYEEYSQVDSHIFYVMSP